MVNRKFAFKIHSVMHSVSVFFRSRGFSNKTGISVLVMLLVASPVLVMADGGQEILAWVTLDESGNKKLSNGAPAPAGAIPGQFYEIERGRLKMEKQWRSPLDMLFKYNVGRTGRVEFSHERHFSVLGEKKCSSCHDDSKGLGEKGNVRISNVKSGEKEAHNNKSLGRFCAGCHDGAKDTNSVSAASASLGVSGKIFSANKGRDPESCNRCHAPANHRSDFTNRHGELAEHSRSNECASCHRGADHISSNEQNQARQYKQAQLQLVNNPENETAFKIIGPANFCAYCHKTDSKPWEKERKSYFRNGSDRDDD